MSGGRGSRRFPPNRGVQWSDTAESTLWGMALGAAAVVDIVLGLAEIVPASCQSLRAAWSSLLEVRSSICDAVAFGGPPQVKVLRAPAGVGHAAVLNPLDGVQARAPGSLGDTWRSRTPRGGVRDSGCG